MGCRWAKFEDYKHIFECFIGAAQALIAAETLQVNDYAKYGMTMFDEAARKKDGKQSFRWTVNALMKRGPQCGKI